MPVRETAQRRESSKERTGRIRLDYYKKLDPLSKLKGGLTVAAAVAAVVWLSGMGFSTRPWSNRAERTRALINPGTLARAHATWDSECQACHVPNKPIDGTTWAARFVTDARASDARCQTCHAVPDHHAAITPGAESSCASCHHDHRGREASLVAVGDRDCTRCHSALGEHVAKGRSPEFAAAVTRFDADRTHHPEFALFRKGAPKDPGKVKFNHALHMTRGLTLQPDGRASKNLNDLAPEDRPRYQAGPDGLIQLRCDDCHRPDGDGARATGPLMAPVRYENDCKACHPLDFDPDHPAIRHAIQPAEVVDALWQVFSAQVLKDQPALEAPRPIPGRAENPEIKAAREAVGAKVAKAESLVFGEKRCGECHPFQAPKGVGVVAGPELDPWKNVKVDPPNVNAVWFRHASFDHSAHTAVSCRACHAAAYPGKGASLVSGDVIMPRVAVCQTCHAHREKTETSVTGGAGFACTECHRYHGGDAPTAGHGGLARGAAVEADLKEFLLGAPGQKGNKASGAQ